LRIRDAEGIPATVTLIEELGSATVVHAQENGQKLIAVLQGQQKMRPGDTISLGYDLANVHAFDAAGLRLTTPMYS
jgi:multiple sugar transport system ATP-binding protein